MSYQKVPISTEVYPGVPRDTQRYREVPRATHKYPEVYGSTERYPKVPTVPKGTHECQRIPWGTQRYQKVKKGTQEYIQKYSEVQRKQVRKVPKRPNDKKVQRGPIRTKRNERYQGCPQKYPEVPKGTKRDREVGRVNKSSQRYR